MKLFPKVFLYAFILLLIYSVTSAAVVSVYSESIIKEQVYEHLVTAADSRAHNIETLLHEYQMSVITLAINPVFIKSFDASIPYQQRYSDSFEQANVTMSRVHAIHKLWIVDYNGTVFLNTKSTPGEKLVNITALRIFAVNSTYISPMRRCSGNPNETILPIAASLKDENATRGFLVISFVANNELYDILTEELGMGKTGETYIVNRDGYLLSPSRFMDGAVLNLQVQTETIHHWDEHLASLNSSYGNHTDYEPYNISVYEGYRGIEVLGTHIHIIPMDIVLIAEMESEEAFEPVTNMILYISATSTSILLIGSLAAFFATRRLTRPVLDIHEGMKKIEKGNYEIEYKTKSDDELGDLARSLSHMAIKVKESKRNLEDYNRELEAKVAERTTDLNNRMKESEKFRIATLNMLEDISETKKKLEQSGKLNSSVINTSMDGIMIIQDLKVKFVNPAFLCMLEYTEEEALKLTLQDIFNPEIHMYIQDLYNFDKGDIGPPERFETLFLSKSRENIPVEVRTARMFYDGRAAILNFTKDLRETAILEASIASALTELQKAKKRREEFIDMAAHEFRTPLTAIKTYVEMMEEGYMGTFNEEEKEHLETLGKSISKLNEQITGLLDTSKIIAGKMNTEKVLVDMKEIADETVKELNPLFIKKGQKVNIEVNGIRPVLANPDLMRRVMINLISNANKFTPDGGRIDIRLSIRDGDLIVEVQDNGIGISKTDLPQVFERFFIGNKSLTGEQQQLGLGLSVVKVIVEQHNGEIWVESELGKGSCFHFTIPMMPKKEPAMEEQIEPNGG